MAERGVVVPVEDREERHDGDEDSYPEKGGPSGDWEVARSAGEESHTYKISKTQWDPGRIIMAIAGGIYCGGRLQNGPGGVVRACLESFFSPLGKHR